MESEETTITLSANDAAFVWKADGSVESHLPLTNKDDDFMVEPGTPEGWAVLVTLLFGDSHGCLEQRTRLWEWVEAICGEEADDADTAPMEEVKSLHAEPCAFRQSMGREACDCGKG